LICKDRSRHRRGRHSWRTWKDSGHIDRNRGRDCHDFRKERILAQTRDALELLREIRHQSVTLFAGRVLEQPTDMLTKFISLRKQSIVLSSSRHGATETKRKEKHQIYKYRMAHRRNYSHSVMPLKNFLWKCNMGYTLYPWISLLESTLEISYKPQT